MAANYWESTQRKHWQFTRQQLEDIRKKLEDEDQTLVQMYPLPQVRHLSIYFNQRKLLPSSNQAREDIWQIFTEVARLGKRLGVRQQAMATAQLYLRRFYTKVEIRRTNPYLVIATAVYLACKMEECPHHIRLVVSEGRTLWPGKFRFYHRISTAKFLVQISLAVIPRSSGNASSFLYPKWALRWLCIIRIEVSLRCKAYSHSLKRSPH